MARGGIGGEDIGKAEITKKVQESATTGDGIGSGDIRGATVPSDFVINLLIDGPNNLLIDGGKLLLLN